MRHFRDQTIVAIKAPADTQIHIPDPGHSNMMHMKSEQAEIGVYICAEESDPADSIGKPQDGAMALPGEQVNDDPGAENSQQRDHNKGGDDLGDVLEVLEDLEENHPTRNDALKEPGQDTVIPGTNIGIE